MFRKATERFELMDKMGKDVVKSVTEPIWPEFAKEWKDRMKALLYEDGGFESETYGVKREYYLAELGRRRANWKIPELPGREIHPFGWPGAQVTTEEVAEDIRKTRFARNLGWLDPYEPLAKLQDDKLEPGIYGKDHHELVRPEWKDHDFSKQRATWPGWAITHPGIERVYKFSEYYEDPFITPKHLPIASDWNAWTADKDPLYWSPEFNPEKTSEYTDHPFPTEESGGGPADFVSKYTENKQTAANLSALSRSVPQEEPYMSLARQRELRERALRAQQARAREYGSAVNDPTISGRI